MFFINKTNMFSILGYVNDRLKINGRYNFLFHYPDDLPEDFFYFKQSSHPLYSTTASDFSQDFVLNNCELNDTNGREFTGLAKSSSLNSYLDGNIILYLVCLWIYAIIRKTRKNSWTSLQSTE